MASEYLKKKYQDVKPEEKRELTKEEKRKNWWYYHKWHVGIAVVLAAIVIDIAWNALSRVEPDYKIAYVGTTRLPDETARALEAGFASLGEDLNGDGRTSAALTQYVFSGEDPNTAMAAEVTLMADVMECESYFFLLEDPQWFQESYHTLCYLDGSLPAEGDDSAEGTCLAWTGCPVLAGMEMGNYTIPMTDGEGVVSNQKLVSHLYLARRGFWTEKTAEHEAGYQALWDRLTEGAAVENGR